jgi:hypothetical protein
MLRAFRGLCLICFCVLAFAVVVAILELAALPILNATGLLDATGCHSTEILPSFACGEGWVRRSMEIVLNLPVIFIYAALFTFAKNSPPSREFMLLLYAFDAILVLGLVHPLLLFAQRRGKDRRRQSASDHTS